MVQKEIFKPIPGFEGDYEVSNTGKILSLKRSSPSVLKNTVNPLGQRSVNLRTKDNKTSKEYVAKLVFEQFGDLPDDYNRKDYIISVIDGDYDNLSIDNLKIHNKGEFTKLRFKGKNKVTKEDLKDLPSDAILLEPKLYQLNAVEKKVKNEIEPKVSVYKNPEYYTKKGSKYELIEDQANVFLLLAGTFSMDRIADSLNKSFPSTKFSQVRYEALYKKSSESKKPRYTSINCDCAFIVLSGQDAPINSIKSVILSHMSNDYETNSVSRLWMKWDGAYHKVTVNRYDESNLSPVSIRGALTLRLRREELTEYMEDYIFGKSGSIPQDWYTIPCATILLEEVFGKKRPSPKHVLGMRDFNFLNLREDNLIWETAIEREDRIKEKFPAFEILRKRATKNAHFIGLPSDRVRKMVEKHHFLGGKNMTQTARMISSSSDEDFFPRVRYYIQKLRSGKQQALLPEVRELLEKGE